MTGNLGLRNLAIDPVPDAPDLPAAVRADRMDLSLPSHPDWIEPAVEYLRQRALLCGACRDDHAGKLLLALHEALTNSVVHGNLQISCDLKERGDRSFAEALAARSADPNYAGRPVDVAVDYDGRRCQWALTDRGTGFEVEAVLGRDPDDPEAMLRASGRGVLMMRALMDEVRYEEGGRRVILTLHKAGADERRHPRHETNQPLRVMPVRHDGSIDWQAAHDAVARNWSPAGMAILQANLQTTERVIIGTPCAGQPVYLPARVRRCRALGENVLELGCRFELSPDAAPADPALPAGREVEAAVGRLVEQLRGTPWSADERRRHPRVAYTEPVGIAGGPAAEPRSGFARNLSRGGIAFITTAPVAEAVRVLSLPLEGRRPLCLRARVVRCTRVLEGVYEVAARFLSVEERS
jgi:anti-sigma regulatory factor (Ser/Thr protein kinase)